MPIYRLERHGWLGSTSDVLAQQARALLLMVTLLVTLLNAQVVFTARLEYASWSLKVFGWTICMYSFVVLACTVYWTFTATRLRRTEAQDRATKDSLTGLLNWNGLIRELSNPAYDRTSDDKSTRLLALSLLELERINVEHGQLVGDAVIREIGVLLQGSLPFGWKIGRLGGSRFLIIAPMATTGEMDEASSRLTRAVADFSLNLGTQGRADGLRALVDSVPYVPGGGSVREALARGGGFAPPSAGTVVEGREGAPPLYHMLGITLGAFAAQRLEDLPREHQIEFELWRQDPSKDFVNRMVVDLVNLLELRADRGGLDFVTVPPFPAQADQKRRVAAEKLGQQLAAQLGIPFRKVLAPAVGGFGTVHHVEPKLDAMVKPGSGVLLVQDFVSSPDLMRRCVRALSTAGCHVLAIVWAFRSPSPERVPPDVTQ